MRLKCVIADSNSSLLTGDQTRQPTNDRSLPIEIDEERVKGERISVKKAPGFDDAPIGIVIQIRGETLDLKPEGKWKGKTTGRDEDKEKLHQIGA